MGFFDAAQLALASARSVFYAELYQLDFASGSRFYWDAVGNLEAYGEIWAGAASVVARSEVPFGVDDEAGQMVLTMSGVDADLMAMVRAEESEFSGRPITLWAQFFDEALQLSGARRFLFAGTMDVPTYAVSAEGSRSVTIPCEGEWTDRNSARQSMFSHEDQQARYPGDLGLEYAYRITQGVKRVWPQFD